MTPFPRQGITGCRDNAVQMWMQRKVLPPSVQHRNGSGVTTVMRVTGLLQLHKAYGSGRLDRACKMALNAGTPSYTRIKNILKNNMDKALISYNESDSAQSHIPLHHNIRGASSYS